MGGSKNAATNADLSKRVERLQGEDDRRTPEPTEAWLRSQLEQLGAVLKESTPAAAIALRELVGGQIVVTEIRREGRKRHYLQGRFSLHARSVANAALGSIGATAPADDKQPDGISSDRSEEIAIDFVEPNPLDAASEKAKALYDQGLLGIELKEELGCARSGVTRLLRHWHKVRGLEMKDGRARRSKLPRKTTDPTNYQRIADDVKRLADDGLLFQTIADQIHCDANTVTAAWAFWHESRDLAVPDGRTRRKSLNRRVDESPDAKSGAA